MLAVILGLEGIRLGLVATTFGFGFRHGIDWDHIAALADITSAPGTARRSMVLATLYALGHGLVVFALGLGAIVLAARLPAGVDLVMQRVVGGTLIALGLWVLVTLAREGPRFHMRSRWMLVFAGVRGAGRRLRPPTAAEPPDVEHRHVHRHVAALPPDPFMAYGRRTAFLVGMVHGIGAETPTQLLIFLAAAQAGGRAAGAGLLACFVAGLLVANSVVAAVATLGQRRMPAGSRAYRALSAAVAAFSLAVGTVLAFGGGDALPALLGA